MPLTKKQIEEYRKRYAIQTSPIVAEEAPPEGLANKIWSTLADIPNDLKQAFTGSRDAVTRGFETADQARQQVESDEISPLAGTLKTIGGGLRAGAEVVGQGVLAAGKSVLTQNREDKISSAIEPLAQGVGESDTVQFLVEKYQSLSPEKKALVDGTLGISEGLGTMFGLGPSIKALRFGVSAPVRGGLTAARGGGELLKDAYASAKTLFSRPAKTVDEVVNIAEETLGATPSIDLSSVNKQLDELIAQGKHAEAKTLAQQTAPNISFKEKWVNLRPDIKQRIQGKPEMMQEYFDVTHARNANDTVPTVFEHGGNYARKASEVMEGRLNATGGEIGSVRKKLGTYKAPREAVEKINNSFSNELGKLNLEIRNGKIQQIAGTQSRLQANGDLKVLQDLYDELKITNQSPELTNIIDVRTNFDGKINFAKGQREVSSSVDPLARRIRKELAETAAGIVGKEGAGDLKKYSEFMEAFNDIKSFTDKKAGGEYLLRMVLSGRGGEARQIIQTIKEYTDIDLMDHATMMQIANELIGNEAQKNLFRQEITKAGLDVASLLKGDPSGAAYTLFQKTVDRFVDPEKIFLNAAKSK